MYMKTVPLAFGLFSALFTRFVALFVIFTVFICACFYSQSAFLAVLSFYIHPVPITVAYLVAEWPPSRSGPYNSPLKYDDPPYRQPAKDYDFSTITPFPSSMFHYLLSISPCINPLPLQRRNHNNFKPPVTKSTLLFGAGPTPKTVMLPASICVRPASTIASAVIPSL